LALDVRWVKKSLQCYRSVHYWVQKLKGIESKVRRRYRRAVAIDETKLKVNGRHLFVSYGLL
jgi:transposase-like protein